MSAQVQRKLEFPVRKTRNSTRKESAVTDTTEQKSARSTRTSRRVVKKLEEEEVTPLYRSPRKRHSDDDEDTENCLVFTTPSPVKRKKDHPTPIRRDETPIRASLAAKLASVTVSDDNKGTDPIKQLLSPEKPRIVLSPVKLSQNCLSPARRIGDKSPLKRCLDLSPVKSSPSKTRLASPFKITKDALSSPMKSKQEAQTRLASPFKITKDALSSPIKSKQEALACLNSRQISVQSSPAKKRLDLTSSSPVKARAVTPSKKNNETENHSPLVRLAKQDCSAYHQAKQSFHTAKPERLVGRDEETAEIKSFLKGHMTKKTAGSLYISGAPGTGKTAVLTHILDELKSIHKCKTVYLNCMTLDNSAAVYGKLYTDISGKNAPTAKERLRAVERLLTSDGPSIVMVLDEIDQLDSKNQEVLYTIFEWPSLAKSRLILVGIANALDLTDRVLPRLQARPKCKPQLLNFAPYTREQITAILKDRLKDLEKDGVAVMDSTAIQFCARKISAVAGDMRKALDVCRRAVELVEHNVRSQRVLKSQSGPASPVKKAASPAVPKKIGVVHINNVLSEVYGSGATAQAQETVPLQQKLVVCSLLLLVKQGKMKEVTAGKLHDVYSKVCKKRQMEPLDQTEFQGVVSLLEARGILGLKKAKEARMTKVQLKLDEKELEHTMQDKVLISAILTDGLPK